MGPGATVGIHIEETVFLKFQGEGKPENFVRDHLEMSQLMQMLLCPACCLYVPWQGKEHKMMYKKECGICSCPYAVKLDDQLVGKFHDVGCCDNGVVFCLCPCLTCNGFIKIMGIDGSDAQEKFIFAKKLHLCWPCIQNCATFCVPFGICLTGMDGCCHYCSGTEFKSIRQPVYKGPWSRANNSEDPERIGEFVMSQRFQPVCCCCAVPTPLKYYFLPTTPYGEGLKNDELAALSLVLQIYRGMPAPCKLCAGKGFQVPTGVSCMDMGLSVKTDWRSVDEIMKESD